MPKKQKLVFLLMIVMLIIAPVFAFADNHLRAEVEDRGLICPRPVLDSGGLVEGTRLVDCIPRLYDFALGIAGLIALAVLIAAGYLMMTAGGDGKQLTTAKEMGAAAAGGIVILLTAYILLNFLNPNLVELNQPDIDTPESSSTTEGVNSEDRQEPLVSIISVSSNSVDYTIDTTSTPPRVEVPRGLSTVRFAATATDNSSVIDSACFRVRFACEDALTDDNFIYFYIWDVSGLPQGTYPITFEATDSNNNTGEQTINLTIIPPSR